MVKDGKGGSMVRTSMRDLRAVFFFFSLSLLILLEMILSAIYIYVGSKEIHSNRIVSLSPFP
jgi:hypothetical protein